QVGFPSIASTARNSSTQVLEPIYEHPAAEHSATRSRASRPLLRALVRIGRDRGARVCAVQNRATVCGTVALGHFYSVPAASLACAAHAPPAWTRALVRLPAHHA